MPRKLEPAPDTLHLNFKCKITEEHDFQFLTKHYHNRPLYAVNIDPVPAACLVCNKLQYHNPIIGCQHAQNVDEFTPVCVSCSVKKGWIADPALVNLEKSLEQSIELVQKQKLTNVSLQLIEDEEKELSNMPLNLGKKIPSKPAAATEEKAKTTTNGGGGGLQLEEEAPSPKAVTKAVEKLEASKTTGGMTKADVLDVVNAALAEFQEKLWAKLKEFEKANKTNLEHFQSLGKEMTGLRKDIEDAMTQLSGGEVEEEVTEEAPAKPEKKTTATTTKKEKKATTWTPETKPQFADFMNSQCGDEGCEIDPLLDTVIELKYFKVVPEDRDSFKGSFVEFLGSKGYAVDDEGHVTRVTE